jgi:hypothetical protein
MGFHIKRDGGYLCGTKIIRKGIWQNKYRFITFSDAHKYPRKELDLRCCAGCKKRYYEIFKKLKKPIII